MSGSIVAEDVRWQVLFYLAGLPIAYFMKRITWTPLASIWLFMTMQPLSARKWIHETQYSDKDSGSEDLCPVFERWLDRPSPLRISPPRPHSFPLHTPVVAATNPANPPDCTFESVRRRLFLFKRLSPVLWVLRHTGAQADGVQVCTK
jgi:hypothetical protein